MNSDELDEDVDETNNVPLPALVMPNLTDAEWNERDRVVRAQREAEDSAAKARSRVHLRAELAERGLADKMLAVLFEGGTKVDTSAWRASKTLPERGLIVMGGNVGCGKSLAAHSWLVRGLARAGGRCIPSRIKFVSAHEFSRASRFGSKFAELEEPDKIVIDDLGAEYLDDKGSVLSDLDAVLDARWRSSKGTLLTTNLARPEFERRYRARITDRLRDGTWVDCSHPSLRGGVR